MGSKALEDTGTEFVLEMQHRVEGSLGELLSEPQVEVADLLQHKFQLVGGRQYGHPAEEDVIKRGESG